MDLKFKKNRIKPRSGHLSVTLLCQDGFTVQYLFSFMINKDSEEFNHSICLRSITIASHMCNIATILI